MTIQIIPNFQLFKLLARKTFPDGDPAQVDISNFEVQGLNIVSVMGGKDSITRDTVDETIRQINSGDTLCRTMFYAARRSLLREGQIEINQTFGKRTSIKINLFEMLGIFYCGVINNQIYVSREQGDMPKVSEDDEDSDDKCFGQETKAGKRRMKESLEIDGLTISGESDRKVIVFQKGIDFKGKTVMLNLLSKDSIYTPLPIPITLN